MKAPLGAKLKNLFKQDLVKKVRKAFIYQVFGAAAAFLSNVVLARFLGVNTYGVYSFSTNLQKLLLIPTLLGFGTYTLRYYPRKLEEKSWSHLKGYKRFTYLGITCMSILAIAISYIVIYHTKYVLPENRDPYMVFILSLPLYAFVNLLIATAQARHKLTLALLPNYVLLPALLSFFNISIYYLITKNISAVAFAWIYVGSNLIILIYQIIGLNRFKIKELQFAKPVYAIKEWLSTSLPMLFTSSLQILLKTADVFMIGLLMTPRDVGIYNAALKIDNIILFGLTAVNFVEAPIISKLYGAGDMKGLQKTVKQSAWLIFVFTIFISMPVVFFGKPILSLFGEEFKVAFWPLIIILISNAFNALSGSVGLLMSMTKHQKEAFYITAASALICIVLNYFFINLWGIVGASIAIAISVVIRNTTMVVYVKKVLGINATVLPF